MEGVYIRTSVGPLVSAHVSKVHDMLAMQTLQEDGEAVRFDLADRHTQGLYPRWGNWQKGVCAHGSDSMPLMTSSPTRAVVVVVVVSLAAKGAAVGMVVCLASMSCQMQTICLSRKVLKGRAQKTATASRVFVWLATIRIRKYTESSLLLTRGSRVSKAAKTMQRSCQVQVVEPLSLTALPGYCPYAPGSLCRDIF